MEMAKFSLSPSFYNELLCNLIDVCQHQKISSGLARFQQSGETGTALAPSVGVLLSIKGTVGKGMWRGR